LHNSLVETRQKKRKEKEEGIVHVNKKVDEIHMRTKCPKEPRDVS
jgi:hypothetical protein